MASAPSMNMSGGNQAPSTENPVTLPDELVAAYEEQMAGNYESAAKLFKEFFIKYLEDKYAQRAVGDYAKCCDYYLKPNEIIYEFENTLEQIKNSKVHFNLTNALITVFSRDGKHKEAMSKIDEICEDDLTVEQENQMDIHRAYLYIYDLNDSVKGQACLEEVLAKSSKGDAANEIAAYELSILTGTEEKSLSKQSISQQAVEIPTEFKLHGNYPNPFNPTTNIKFSLAAASEVTISIYNVIGQKVRTLTKSGLNTGTHQITWDGRNELGQEVTSGLYIMRFEARSSEKTFMDTKRMLLIR